MRIEVDGQPFDVPDDATPAEIDTITKPTTSTDRAPTMGERLKYAAHKTAGYLPAAGGIAGGVMGAGVGGAVGLPTTGPGGILTAIAGGATGAGLGAAGGDALRRAIDVKLGYEKDPGLIGAIKQSARVGGENAAYTAGGSMAGSTLAAAAGPAAKALEKGAIGTTRRILRNVGGSISVKKPLPDDAALEVLDEGIVKYGGTSGGATQRLETARSAVGQRYAAIVKQLEANGVTGPDALDLAWKYAQKVPDSSATSMNPAVPQVYKSAAEQLGVKPTQGGRLSLTQTEELKRSLQGQARSAYKQMQPDELGAAHEDAASMMRQATEDAISQQAGSPAMTGNPAVQEAAAQFEPVKQQAGRLIQASSVAREGAARAANRNWVSPADIAAFVGEQAHSGNPVRGAGAALLMHLLRTRGPSTFAAAAHDAAGLLEQIPPDAPEKAASLGSLLLALRRNRSEVQ